MRRLLIGPNRQWARSSLDGVDDDEAVDVVEFARVKLGRNGPGAGLGGRHLEHGAGHVVDGHRPARERRRRRHVG